MCFYSIWGNSIVIIVVHLRQFQLTVSISTWQPILCYLWTFPQHHLGLCIVSHCLPWSNQSFCLIYFSTASMVYRMVSLGLEYKTCSYNLHMMCEGTWGIFDNITQVSTCPLSLNIVWTSVPQPQLECPFPLPVITSAHSVVRELLKKVRSLRLDSF